MNQPNESAPARPRVSPFCQHLTSKKTVLADAPPRTVEDVMDASQACWCAKTQTILGPDRFVCHPEDCNDPERTCFESPLRDLL